MAETPRSRRRPALVTLSSDLGPEYSAQVKAVLARSVDPARVVELSHSLPAHGVAEAAFLLRSMARGFPAGTVHLAVVDPGVGGRRAPVAIACADGSRLVGPDNGLLAPLAAVLGRPRAYRLDPERVGGAARVGTTFDGRDLFAPAAARLALGERPGALGSRVPLTDYRIPAARRTGPEASGEVLHVDRFGNLITNIPSSWIGRRTTRLALRVGSRRLVAPWAKSYEEGGDRRLVVLGSSFGTVEVAVGRGSAARRLGAKVGSRVALRPHPAAPAPLNR